MHFSRLASCSTQVASRGMPAPVATAGSPAFRLAAFYKAKAAQWEQEATLVKIKVNLVGNDGQPLKNLKTLMLNRRKSTPYHCAKHVSSAMLASSILACRIEDSKVLSLHQPLMRDCTLRMVNANLPIAPAGDGEVSTENVRLLKVVNEAYWRSCSVLLGATLETAFKEQFECQLIGSPPSADISSGAFAYDVVLPTLQEWRPTRSELDILSRRAVKLIRTQNCAFDPLCVSKADAVNMFDGNDYKLSLLDEVTKPSPVTSVVPSSDDPFVDNDVGADVKIVRVGGHVELLGDTRPLTIANTAHVGLYSIVKAQRMTNEKGEVVHRFYGTSLPQCQMLPAHAWGIVCQHAQTAECSDAAHWWRSGAESVSASDAN